MEFAARCRTEVRDLHAFFAAWFNGAIENTDERFERFPEVLDDAFRMVVPSGETLDRATVLSRVRNAHGSSAAARTEIEIRNHVNVVEHHAGALVTYEEWQIVPGAPDRGRVSTAYFEPAPAAPNGVRWVRVHETWLPE